MGERPSRIMKDKELLPFRWFSYQTLHLKNLVVNFPKYGKKLLRYFCI